MSTSKLETDKFDGKSDFVMWQRKMKAILVQNKIAHAICNPDKYPESWKGKIFAKKLGDTHSCLTLHLNDNVLREIDKKTMLLKSGQNLKNPIWENSLAGSVFSGLLCNARRPSTDVLSTLHLTGTRCSLLEVENRQRESTLLSEDVDHGTFEEFIQMEEEYNMSLFEAVEMTPMRKTFTTAIAFMRGYGDASSYQKYLTSCYPIVIITKGQRSGSRSGSGTSFRGRGRPPRALGDSSTILPFYSSSEQVQDMIFIGYLADREHFIALHIENNFALPPIYLQWPWWCQVNVSSWCIPLSNRLVEWE
ncbi:hypothetical protein M9H77_07745 [Catharanthus roseus]|uniref:Uncharacterized protein n=1 Tax=Catharanthus roseus TaxID=4058 RepID=A0ACC0BVV6_CATRO|nr:hypothetical protein M9H77_07745 [Catharanthus roseus]